MISASSFWIRLAEVDRALELKAFAFAFLPLSRRSVAAADDDELLDDILDVLLFLHCFRSGD